MDQREATALLRIYRVVDPDQIDTPFSGPNSDSGGRWTSEGTQGVYTSLSAATALLEFLVHLDGDETPGELWLASAWLPSECLFVPREIPPDWNERPYRPHVRDIGDDWSRSRRSLGLHVPSAVCPPEGNIIINPGHADFSRLVVGPTTPLALDERLRRPKS